VRRSSKEQKSKKRPRSKRLAPKIRRIAREILRQAKDRSMTATQLWLAVRGEIGVPMRSDFLLLNLLRGRGFMISHARSRAMIVSLTNGGSGKEVKRVRRRASSKGSKRAGRISIEEFTTRAIKALRDPKKSKGIHAVWSGFNRAFREYFPGKDPVEEMQRLVKAGKIELLPMKGGVMIYLPGDGPTRDSSKEPDEVLRRIGVA
jgi:hypothetical protein